MKIRNKILLIAILVIGIVISTSAQVHGVYSNEEKKYEYISNIPYIAENSFADKKHTIHTDLNDRGKNITLKINGKEKRFLKGMGAWATSEIVYDISKYNYDYFTSYIGIDVNQINKRNEKDDTGVIFSVFLSQNGKDWKKQENIPGLDEKMIVLDDAKFVKVPLNGAKYIKLVANNNGVNRWWDSYYDEAVWADAKLIKEGFVEENFPKDDIKTVEEYDKIIKEKYENKVNIEDYELTLLQREFVNNIGYDLLEEFVNYDIKYREIVSWLMNNKENLKLYITGGEPEGTHTDSLKVLSRLYVSHKEDLEDKTLTENGVVFGDLYKRMMVSISLTYSKDISFWNDREIKSDPVARYEVLKEFHKQKIMDSEYFDKLPVEDMRFVMTNQIDETQMIWLNKYVREKNDGNRDPYHYITYGLGYNYDDPKYYAPENRDEYEEKYELSKNGLLYDNNKQRLLWKVFEEGAVCGGISHTGSNIQGSFGVPAFNIGQPSHAAYLYYKKDEKTNKMIWRLENAVAGWGMSEVSGRMLNSWGNKKKFENEKVGYVPISLELQKDIKNLYDEYKKTYGDDYNVSYIALSQKAIDDMEKYSKSLEYVILANVYQDDINKKIEIYNKAIEIQPIHFDAWMGLVDCYKQDKNRTGKDYLKLANRISEVFTYYPSPSFDLLSLIECNLTDKEDIIKINLLKHDNITKASMATEEDVDEASICVEKAKFLLRESNVEIAKFSFDGEKANTIVLSDIYKEVGSKLQYSLDGGKTWKITNSQEVELTKNEIDSITEENDIYVNLVGASDDHILRIDITKGDKISKVYNNDLENRVIGVNSNTQWSFDKINWKKFADEELYLTGDKTVYVRNGKTGTKLEGDIAEFTFNEDQVNEKETYIPISHLSLNKVSSQQSDAEAGRNIIDGNINTIWHSKYNKSDKDRFVIIEIDNLSYISKIEYVPRQDASNGRIKSGKILVSEDGKNWTNETTFENWENDSTTKIVEFKEPIKAKYIKLQATETWGGDAFISGAMINLFEDITVQQSPTAEIEYSTTELTNENVVAKLVNPSKEITITNNNGKDTYTFTENGSFKFEFVDKYGNKGTAEAKVDWIEEKEELSSNKYLIKDNEIRNVLEQTTLKEFKKNLKSNKEIKIVNAERQELKENDMVGSGTIVKVGDSKEYEVILIGDVDGDGRLTLNDLAKLKLNYLEIEKLQGSYLEAGDLDNDNLSTINDIAKFKRIMLGL